MEASPRRLAAIMFTDMVDYSALAQADETAALSTLGRHNQLLRSVFGKYRGREVKTVGDAFLVEFDSAVDAARCAVEVQRTLHEYNTAHPEGRAIRVRIGIHVGDVVLTDGDLLGDAVNIASRIEPLADPGGIVLTQQAYDQVQNKLAEQVVRLPPTPLKNIRQSVSVYKILPAWAGGGTPAPSLPSRAGHNLAVLPLTNISPDPKDEYFADGLTEELISVLSQVRDLDVIARTSVMAYKSASKTIAQVGAELGVDSVLEGSVRKAGNRIRITLQLIDVATQRHIWATSYNREVDDVFAVQSDIADRTAEALRLQLSNASRPGGARRPTANLAAYDLYLKGLVAASKRGDEAIDEGVRCFEAATTMDPTFADAFAAWAELYVVAAGDYRPMREVMPRARKLAARAVELDPDSSDAHAALANIAMQFDHDWRRAEDEYRKAITLNPSNAEAYRFLGLLYMSHLRFEEAKEVFRHATRLDPGSTNSQQSLLWAEFESGNIAPAIQATREECAREPAPSHDHVFHGFNYLRAGLQDDALKEAERPLTGTSEVERFDHAILDALVGRTEAARAVANAVERGDVKTYISPADLAMLYAALGEKSRALDLLEKDWREGDQVLWLYYRGTFFDSIRNEPRFIELVHAYGLPADRADSSAPPRS